jgi:hypothetical protein
LLQNARNYFLSQVTIALRREMHIGWKLYLFQICLGVGAKIVGRDLGRLHHPRSAEYGRAREKQIYQ